MNLGLDSWLPFALSENQELTYLIHNNLKFKLQLPYTIQQRLTLYHRSSKNKQCIAKTRKFLILGRSMIVSVVNIEVQEEKPNSSTQYSCRIIKQNISGDLKPTDGFEINF